MKATKQATKNLWQGDGSEPTGTTAAESQPPSPPESKAYKFIRLAQRRVPQAIARINQLVPLSNRNNYTFTPEHAEKIAAALRAAVEVVVVAFSATTKAVSTFTF
jgi:hypothetical protein